MSISSPLPQRLRITHSSSPIAGSISIVPLSNRLFTYLCIVSPGVSSFAVVASTQVSGALNNHLILRLNTLVQASRKFASASKLSCRLHDTIAIACLPQRSNVFCSTCMTPSRNLRPRHTCCRSIDSFKCTLATTVIDLANPKFGRLKLPPEDFRFERGGETGSGAQTVYSNRPLGEPVRPMSHPTEFRRFQK